MDCDLGALGREGKFEARVCIPCGCMPPHSCGPPLEATPFNTSRSDRLGLKCPTMARVAMDNIIDRLERKIKYQETMLIR